MGIYEDCNSLNGKIDKELKACEARLRTMEAGVQTTLDPRAEAGGGTQGDDMLALCKKLASLHKPYHAFLSKYWNELKGNSTDRRIRKAESKQKKLETEVLTVSQEIADNTDTYVKAVESGAVKEAIHKQVSKSISKSGGAC